MRLVAPPRRDVALKTWTQHQNVPPVSTDPSPSDHSDLIHVRKKKGKTAAPALAPGPGAKWLP